MATTMVLCFLSLVLLSLSHKGSSSSCSYTSIFSFGDSIADTGHRAIAPDHTPSFCINPPYGMTFFERPTGRCSDGRLILDFIAEAMGVPLLPPYLGQASSGTRFMRGVNFAVAGATAINNTFFVERGVSTWTNNSLEVQVEWFKSMLPSLCPEAGSDCEIMRKSLFIVGEIGGNDVNYPFLQGKTLQEVNTLVPLIISAIMSSIKELMRLGARSFMVPGNFPIGCSASYLTYFASPDKEDYDPSTGCLTWLNQFSQAYNQRLQNELAHLRMRNPEATIFYADYYKAAMRIFRNPARFGFTNALEACCGGYDARNNGSSSPLKCGQDGVKMCINPSTYVNWDGVHLTEAAYETIATGLLEGTFTYPSAAGLCPNVISKEAMAGGSIVDI